MRTIWKIPFEIKEFQQLDIPRGAKKLHVGLDAKGLPAIWYEVNPEAEKRPVVFYVVGTGNVLSEDAVEYMGTVVWKHTATVWHLYGV